MNIFSVFIGGVNYMKKRILSLIAVSAMVVSVFAGCGGGSSSTPAASGSGSGSSAATNTAATGDAEYKIRVGHVLANTHPYELGLKKLSEIAAEKSGGKIAIDVFGNSQLGNERDMVEALQLGSQEMVLVSTAVLSSFTDQFLVFDLPFMFDSTEDARMVCDSDLGTEILHSIDDQGITGLTWFENGFRQVTNNVRPIEKPEDLKGIKIRTMESPIHMASFSVMGADPTPMAMGELFTALQQGTLDAQENPLAIIDTNKFYEIQKYLSMTSHFYAPAPLFVSTDYFNTMDEESQEILKESAKEAAAYERQCLDDMNKELQGTLADDGMVVNEVDKAPFKEAVQSVYDEYTGTNAGQVNPDILAQVQEMLNK